MKIKYIPHTIPTTETTEVTKNVTHIHYASGVSQGQTYAHHCYTTAYQEGSYQTCTHTASGASAYNWQPCWNCHETTVKVFYAVGNVCGQTYWAQEYKCSNCGSSNHPYVTNGGNSFSHTVGGVVTRYKCPWTQGATVMGSLQLKMRKKAKRYTLYVDKAGNELQGISTYLWSNGSTGNEILVTANGTYSCAVTIVETKSLQPHTITLQYNVNFL